MEYVIGADAEFLRVTVSGRDIDKPPSALCAAVLEQSARLGRPRILIELDQKFPLSPRSQTELIENLPRLGFTSAHKSRSCIARRSPRWRTSSST